MHLLNVYFNFMEELKMSRDELIKKLEELDRVLVEEMGREVITDYAREQAHINFVNLIDIIKENEEDECDYE